MQVTETLSDGLKRAYTVVVPAEEVAEKRAARIAELGRSLKLPGFRPGKVPLPLVRQRYGAAISAEVVEQSVSEATSRLLSERGLRPAGQPRIGLAEAKPAEGADLAFTLEFELLPEIELPDFSSITLTRLKAEVSEEAIDWALSRLAEGAARLEEITETRGAARGEFVEADFIGRIGNETIPAASAKGALIEISGSGPLPGFVDRIEGIAAGETRRFSLTFPPDGPPPELAGKEVEFEITAKRLCRRIVPAIDENFAGRAGFENLAELREAMATQLRRDYERLSRLRLKRALLDVLAGLVRFVAPETLVEAEFGGIWREVEANRRENRIDEEDRGKDEKALRAEYRAIAERRVRLGLVLAEIGRVHQISVSEEEVNRAMRAEAARYPGRQNQALALLRKRRAVSEGLRGSLFEDKVVDFVIEMARVEDKTVSAEELAAMPPAPVD